MNKIVAVIKWHSHFVKGETFLIFTENGDIYEMQIVEGMDEVPKPTFRKITSIEFPL